jgi:predicted metal-dependent hydrolase
VTAWEVIDDAVKIGIGAIIGLVGARFAHTREWRTQRKARRIETLENIAKDFEDAHRALDDLSVEVRTRQIKLQKLPSPKEAAMVVRSRINSVESRLQLLGYKECVSRVRKYWNAASNFTAAMVEEGSGAEEKFAESKRTLWTAREEFYAALRAEYQSSENTSTM